jgi:hypothetical protein
MQPLCKHPYKKVSASGEIDKAKEEDADTPTTPFKMISSIMIGTLAFAAITWSSYSLTSMVFANHNYLPSSSSSSSTFDVGNTFDNNFDNTVFEISTIDVSSSFERHWPGDHIPPWATKKINFIIPREQEICFTHVGKAGGSTIGCSLGFSLHCDDDNSRGMDDSVQIEHLSSSLLAKLTTHTFHKVKYTLLWFDLWFSIHSKVVADNFISFSSSSFI